MLVIGRLPGQKVQIGKDVTLTLLSVHGNRARIGIEAPDDTAILREELWVRLKGCRPQKRVEKQK
jgi:carbon storage regulator